MVAKPKTSIQPDRQKSGGKRHAGSLTPEKAPIAPDRQKNDGNHKSPEKPNSLKRDMVKFLFDTYGGHNGIPTSRGTKALSEACERLGVKISASTFSNIFSASHKVWRKILRKDWRTCLVER